MHKITHIPPHHPLQLLFLPLCHGLPQHLNPQRHGSQHPFLFHHMFQSLSQRLHQHLLLRWPHLLQRLRLFCQQWFQRSPSHSPSLRLLESPCSQQHPLHHQRQSQPLRSPLCK